MTTGELWVAHPLFPWIMIVLGWWVLCSTAVMVRNYRLIRRLEQHNKLLQAIVMEGIGHLAKQIRAIQDGIPILKPLGREKERTSELLSRETRVQIEEPEPAAIEEADEVGDHIAVTTSKDTERAGVRSP